MKPVTVFLGLGSNMGSREAHLRNGVQLLARSLEVVETSSIYETEPWGYSDQPSFLNMVCRAQTAIAPEDLLLFCQDVEREVGRKPTFHHGPRVLDVDILAYGEQIIATPALEVPHPQLAERAFVLVPLAEVAPEWTHPVLGKSVSQLLEQVSGKEGVRLWSGPLAPSGTRCSGA